MLIDTHAHLFNEYYNDIINIIKISNEKGVDIIINAGCDQSSNEEVLNSISINNIYGSIGIHPEYADSYSDADLKFIEDNLNNKKIVSIGEIGLDYHYEGFNKEKQIELFEKQLSMAEKYNMPVTIHSREATMDMINTLKKYKVTGVIHSFSGSIETAREYIKMGYKLGINGVVTFKNAGIKDVIKSLGISHFVLETDSPYLTPVPFRGMQNNPGYVKVIAEFLSDYIGISPEDICSITNNNVREIYPRIGI